MRGLGGARSARIWLEVEEIEEATEAVLKAARLLPVVPAQAVDIETLLEVHLGASVDYAGDLPDTILGYTRFGSPPQVVVNGRLSELALAPGASQGLKGRWRATLAHEAAHIILHASLASRSSPHLTVDTINPGVEAPGRDGWVEVQANMGMAALLFPRAPFLHEARRMLESQDVMLPLDATSLQAERLVAILAQQFEASREATRWRLTNLGWVAPQAPRSSR